MSNNSTSIIQPDEFEETDLFESKAIAQLVPIAILIIIANGLVLILFAKRRQLRTPPNYVLFSLAICDLTSGIINIPLFIIVAFTPIITSFEWFFYLSKLVNFLNNLTAISACYHILVATTEKYLSIISPVTHRLIRKWTVEAVLGIVWLVSAMVAFFPFAWITSKDRAYQTGHVIFCLVVVFFLPYSFMIYAFVAIFRRISTKGKRRSQAISGPHHSRQAALEKKCLILFVCMAMIYLVCWLPWFILMLLYAVYDKTGDLEIPSHVFLLVRYATSIINPILYTFFRRDFRMALKSLFRGGKRPGSSQTEKCSESKKLAGNDSDNTADNFV